MEHKADRSTTPDPDSVSPILNKMDALMARHRGSALQDDDIPVLTELAPAAVDEEIPVLTEVVTPFDGGVSPGVIWDEMSVEPGAASEETAGLMFDPEDWLAGGGQDQPEVAIQVPPLASGLDAHVQAEVAERAQDVEEPMLKAGPFEMPELAMAPIEMAAERPQEVIAEQPEEAWVGDLELNLDALVAEEEVPGVSEQPRPLVNASAAPLSIGDAPEGDEPVAEVVIPEPVVALPDFVPPAELQPEPLQLDSLAETLSEGDLSVEFDLTPFHEEEPVAAETMTQSGIDQLISAVYASIKSELPREIEGMVRQRMALAMSSWYRTVQLNMRAEITAEVTASLEDRVTQLVCQALDQRSIRELPAQSDAACD